MSDLPCRCSCPHAVALVRLRECEQERDALRAEVEKLRRVAEAARAHLGPPTAEGFYILRAPRPLIDALAALDTKPEGAE